MKIKVFLGLSLVLLLSAAGLWFWIDYRIHSEVDTRLQAAVDSGRYEALEYEDLHFNLKGEVRLENFSVQQQGFEYVLGEVQLRNMDYDNAFPRHVDVSVSGLRFPDGLPQAADGENDTLQRLLAHVTDDGSIPLQINYSHQYDPDNAWQLDTRSDISVPGLLQLGLNSRMRNLSVESLGALEQEALTDPAVVQSRLLPLINDAEFSSLQMVLQDSGIVQAMMEVGGAELNAPAEDYRTLVTSQIRNAYLFLPTGVQDFAQQAGEELATFLEGNRTLTLSLEPAFEGRIEQLMPQISASIFTGDFAKVVELLNLELHTE